MVFNLRLYNEMDTPKDTQNMSNNLVNWGVDSLDPVFSTETGSASGLYKDGNIIADEDADIAIDLTGDFVIGFWAKFAFAGESIDSYTDKYLILVFEDGSTSKAVIPYTTYDTTSRANFKYYCITRRNGEIKYYIDSTLIGTDTNTGDLNLNSDSLVYLGNPFGTTTDETLIVDDLLIMDTYDTSFVGVDAGTSPATIPDHYYSNISSYTAPIPYLNIPAVDGRLYLYIYE